MKGILVSCSPPSIVLAHPDTGTDETDDTTHTLATGCLTFLNGVRCKLAVLQPGDEIELDADPATEIKATRGVTVED